MTKVFAIDPGTKYSGYVIWDGQIIEGKGKVENEILLQVIELHNFHSYELVIEQVKLYRPADQNLHDTILWYGRFTQQWKHFQNDKISFVARSTVKAALTGSAKASDSAVSAYLKDRFGKPGTKKEPNPITYGMSADIWQAFALAVYWVDLHGVSNELQQAKAS